MERRGVELLIHIQVRSLAWLLCLHTSQSHALLCWLLPEYSLHFGVLLNPVGPTAMEGGGCANNLSDI